MPHDTLCNMEDDSMDQSVQTLSNIPDPIIQQMVPEPLPLPLPQIIPGPPGPSGVPGPSGLSRGPIIAEFYGFFIGEEHEVSYCEHRRCFSIDPGEDVPFVRSGINLGQTISAISETTFNLGEIGTYRIDVQMPVINQAELLLKVNGVEQTSKILYSVKKSRSISGTFLITTDITNTVVSINNPSGGNYLTVIAYPHISLYRNCRIQY